MTIRAKIRIGPSARKPSWFRLSPTNKMRLAQLMDRARRVAGSAVNVASAINEMGPSPKLRNYAAVGSVALNEVLGATRFDPWEESSFVWPGLGYEAIESVSKIFAEHPATKKIATEDRVYQVTDIGDGMIVVFDIGKDQSVWAASDRGLRPSEMLPRIGQEIWKALGSRIWVSFGDLSSGEQVKFEAWSAPEQHATDLSKEVIARARSFLDRGHRRAVMLYGEPGVGKTSIVNAVADQMAAPTLILEQRQLFGLSSGSLNDILSLLRPEIVIIDDFDRFGDGGFQLGVVDRIRRTSKLLLVTVNDLDRIDAAVIRAGRIDDVVHVQSVRWPRDIVPELSDALVAELVEWPIAFVDELRVRLDVLGPDAMDDEVAMLRERVALQQKLRDAAKESAPQSAEPKETPE